MTGDMGGEGRFGMRRVERMHTLKFAVATIPVSMTSD